MSNLKHIKSKIKSVSNLKKITRALEVVSTVKLQKSKDHADALKNYLVDLMGILSNLGEKVDIFSQDEEAPQKRQHRTLAIVVSSDRGLC